MNRNILLLFFCFLFSSIKLFAQTNAYSGTWQMVSVPDETGASPVNIELQIAASERNILYPAHLKLQCDSFFADYELLLVKKNIRELAISKNKYPATEKPFSLGNWFCSLNGVFDNSRGAKGIATLSAIRIRSKQTGISAADTIHLNKKEKMMALRLRNFLQDADIILKKINDTPWENKDAQLILSPTKSRAYFGLQDTIHVQSRDGTMNLSNDKKNSNDNDIVSVTLNGQVITDQIELSKKDNNTGDVFLDTGLNILTFFADNFGNGLPNKSKLNLQFGDKKITLDFANKADSAATFIVAKLYLDKDEKAEKEFENYPLPADEKPLQKNEKLLSSFIATDQQLTFAIWDDAVEDGDSVSININGKWLVQGFQVKIKPQFIPVTLKPGPNTITFIADNLGSIPPNTSVLEIIDGNKRKSFTIETTPEDRNLIKIFYDIKN
jgi:hypothetical protein